MACSSLIQNKKTDDAYILERANQRWGFLTKGEFKDAYQFETPGYRQSKSLNHYRGQFGGWTKWTGAKALNVNRSSDEIVEVRIELKYDVFLPFGGEVTNDVSYFNEKWIFLENDWWHVSG